MADTIGIKMARAYPAQIEAMRKWFQELEAMLDDETKDNADIGLFVAKTFEQRRIDEYERVLFGYETLFDNACDPNLSYLSFKPEIIEALTAFQHRVQGDEGDSPASEPLSTLEVSSVEQAESTPALRA